MIGIAFMIVGVILAAVAGMVVGVLVERFSGATLVPTPDRWRLALNAASFALVAAARSLGNRAPDVRARCLFEAKRLRTVRDELP